MIISNCLYSQMLKLIVEYIYNYQLKDYIHSNDEVISYSLVSKMWFSMVSELLLDVLDVRNYSRLEPLMKSIRNESSLNNNSTNNNNNNNNNSINNNNNHNSNKDTSYKLINNNKIYKYKRDSKTSIEQLISLSQQYQRLIVDYGVLPSGEIKLKDYPSNCELDFNYGNSVDENLNSCIKIYNGNIVNKIILDRYSKIITMTYGDLFRKLNPKQISYLHDKHIDHSALFQLKSLESLSFSGVNHVEPRAVSKLNNKHTKLKSLSLSMLFHQIIDQMGYWGYDKEFEDDEYYSEDNNEDTGVVDQGIGSKICSKEYGGLLYPDSIRKDWGSMIKVLSKNKTIQHLEFINICNQLICSYNQNRRSICSQLKSLFIKNSTITSLVLQDIDFLNTTILDGIANNKSIISLDIRERIKVSNELHNMEFKQNQFNNYHYLFNKVLTINKTIQNISITWSTPSLDNLYNILNQSKSNINLQSLSINIKLTHNNGTSFKFLANIIIFLSLPIIEIIITKQINDNTPTSIIILNNRLHSSTNQ